MDSMKRGLPQEQREVNLWGFDEAFFLLESFPSVWVRSLIAVT